MAQTNNTKGRQEEYWALVLRYDDRGHVSIPEGMTPPPPDVTGLEGRTFQDIANKMAQEGGWELISSSFIGVAPYSCMVWFRRSTTRSNPPTMSSI